MTPQQIAARNRANASHSTGPKTEAGKAVVSANALRQGATARLDMNSVSVWLSIILNRPDVTPRDLQPEDEKGYRALMLAKAEVRLAQVETAARDLEARGKPTLAYARQQISVCGVTVDAEMFVQMVRDMMKAPKHTVNNILRIEAFCDNLARISPCMPDLFDYLQRGRLIARYLGEARSQRQRDLADWVKICRPVATPSKGAPAVPRNKARPAEAAVRADAQGNLTVPAGAH
jgi:hypothetical protein